MRGQNDQADFELLGSLAQQLKLPLVQIARLAELARYNQSADYLEAIEQIAELAAELTDNYILSTNSPVEAVFEPVNLAAVFRDSANKLSAIAAGRNCQLRLRLEGKCGPVMADRLRLQAAINSLAHSFIEAVEPNTESLVVLAVHRNSAGLVAGVYGAGCNLDVESFRSSRLIMNHAVQPLPGFSAQASAGVFIADSLFKDMDARLRVSRYQKLSGLAAVFQPSKQLQLV